MQILPCGKHSVLPFFICYRACGTSVCVKPVFRCFGAGLYFNKDNIHIVLGDNIQLSPNVQIYDHDHDYRAEGGLAAMKYKTAPVEIGNNVWIGANCVILRGTKIGDNCVVAAGSVIKGEFPANTLIYQKRETEIKTREVGV